MISDKFTLLIAIVLCIILGFGLGYLSKSIAVKIQINQLEKERDSALLAKATMKEQWEKAIDELSKTRVLLNDTLAALELLKQYQIIDIETKNKIKNIEVTLDPSGSPTDETYLRFRKLLEEANKKNEDYNTMFLMTGSTDYIDVNIFVELRKEAEILLREATDLLIEIKDQI